MADLKKLLNENNQNIKNYIDAIKIKYDSNTKKIILSNEKNVESIIDATEFIKDGMINSIENDGENLVISWNTDAGIETTKIALIDLIVNNSITNAHIAENASITADKLSNEVQEALNKADTAIQSLDGYAMIGNNTDGYTDNTIYGAKAYTEHYADNLTGISTAYSSIKLTEEGYKVAIQADLGIDIKTTGTESTVKFDTSHVIVPNPVNNEDATNKEYVDEAIAKADISIDLTNYVTDSELTSTLTGYAKKDEITGDIIVNNDWADIENKPNIYPTNWDSIQDKPNDIMTLNEYQEYIDQITDNTNEISNLSTALYATNLTAEEAKTKAEAALTTDANGKIQIGGIEFPAMNNNNASIDYSEEYGVAIYTPNGNISLSPPSTGRIKLNGNVTIPSYYSILDEDGYDRLNISSINTADSISILSGQEVCIQGTDSALILNANEVILRASTAYPVIQLSSPNGALTYNQLEIAKSRPDSSIGHSSIILYDDDNNKYEIYVSTSGYLACNQITTT